MNIFCLKKNKNCQWLKILEMLPSPKSYQIQEVLYLTTYINKDYARGNVSKQVRT